MNKFMCVHTIQKMRTLERLPIPLPNFAMCKNLCDKTIGWNDTHFWSTMHIYFSDPKQVESSDVGKKKNKAYWL